MMDSNNSHTIEIDELQEYLKLYTSGKKISIKMYFQYFAYVLYYQCHLKNIP